MSRFARIAVLGSATCPAVLQHLWSLSAVAVALVLAACSNSDGDAKGTSLEGSTAMERYTSLARAKGCAVPATFPPLTEACDRLMVTWIDCVATDLDQCLCEAGDNDLNCEGSYKANEGPARCVAEMEALVAGGCDL